jgi:hypothetical protein
MLSSRLSLCCLLAVIVALAKIGENAGYWPSKATDLYLELTLRASDDGWIASVTITNESSHDIDLLAWALYSYSGYRFFDAHGDQVGKEPCSLPPSEWRFESLGSHEKYSIEANVSNMVMKELRPMVRTVEFIYGNWIIDGWTGEISKRVTIPEPTAK